MKGCRWLDLCAFSLQIHNFCNVIIVWAHHQEFKNIFLSILSVTD
uniref:Uncharacterized protein n=1 Tax=Rhizophora mucronata TaxID=61149 RepID=A0A2P2NGC1_RHIMU